MVKVPVATSGEVMFHDITFVGRVFTRPTFSLVVACFFQDKPHMNEA